MTAHIGFELHFVARRDGRWRQGRRRVAGRAGWYIRGLCGLGIIKGIVGAASVVAGNVGVAAASVVAGNVRVGLGGSTGWAVFVAGDGMASNIASEGPKVGNSPTKEARFVRGAGPPISMMVPSGRAVRVYMGCPGCSGPMRYGRIISLSSCSTMWQCQTNWPGVVNCALNAVTWPG